MILLKGNRHQGVLAFGPFNLSTQKRWKKPANTAQTRLENRTRDSKLDKHATQLKKLNFMLKIHDLMSTRKRSSFVSLQLMSRWSNLVGLKVGVSEFVQKYPHVFKVFQHPVRMNLCCKITCKMGELIHEEESAIKKCEFESVRRVKKLLMMSQTGTLCVHALRLIRGELGLPQDFRDSILGKYTNDFKLVDLETVELENRDAELGVAAVEKWREEECRDKWLSESEMCFAFPINFPTGFVVERGFRDWMKNWQRLSYVKPYDRKEVVRVRTCGGVERFEKRAVGLVHELLSLTVEKMVEVERLGHFRKDFGMRVNVRELLLKHPGIFYISTKGSRDMVFLREAYCKGSLIQANSIYVVRRKMLELVQLGCRSSRDMESREEQAEETNSSEGKYSM